MGAIDSIDSVSESISLSNSVMISAKVPNCMIETLDASGRSFEIAVISPLLNPSNPEESVPSNMIITSET